LPWHRFLARSTLNGDPIGRATPSRSRAAACTVRKAVGTHGQLKFVDTTQADSLRYSEPDFYPAALAAGDRYWVATAIEGSDIAALKSGTAQAGFVSVRFKAKFPAAGTYSVAIGNSAGTRGYPKQIVAPDANENEYTLTFPLDTAGAWLYTSGVGLWMYLALGIGSTYQGVIDAWNASQAVGAAGQTNFMALNTNVMYLKRVHIFPGPIPFPYANANIQRDLAKAQRLYYKTWPQGTAVGTVSGPGQLSWVTNGATYGQQFFAFYKQTMRTFPSITLYSPDSGAAGNIRDVTAAADGNAGANEVYGDHFDGINIPVTDGHLCRMHYTANARLS
jgi:hypothetical protein